MWVRRLAANLLHVFLCQIWNRHGDGGEVVDDLKAANAKLFPQTADRRRPIAVGQREGVALDRTGDTVGGRLRRLPRLDAREVSLCQRAKTVMLIVAHDSGLVWCIARPQEGEPRLRAANIGDEAGRHSLGPVDRIRRSIL